MKILSLSYIAKVYIFYVLLEWDNSFKAMQPNS